MTAPEVGCRDQMRYVMVVLLSLAVGGIVYVLSMRAGEAEPVTVGFGPEGPPPDGDLKGPDAPHGYTYLQVAVTQGPSIHERLQGLVGSLVLIAFAAVAVAGAFYLLGALISRVIEKFVGE